MSILGTLYRIKVVANMKTPDFTFLGVKLGVCVVKYWF